MGPGLAAGSLAGGARDGRVHLKLLVDAEHSVAKVDADADQGVLPAADPRGRTGRTAGAEEGVEDVLEGKALPGVAGAAEAVIGAVLIAGGVVDPALLRVGKDFVGVGDSFEAVRGILTGVHIRVQGARKLSVGLLDLFARRFG